MKNKFITLTLFIALIATGCGGDKKNSSSSVSNSINSTTSNSSISSSSISSSSVSSSASSSISSSSIEPSSSTKSDFDIAKENALIELEQYYETFSEIDYTIENWNTLTSAYNVGIITIEMATIIPEILSAVSSAKSTMDNVERLELEIQVLGISIYENEYIRVAVNARVNDLALSPVSNINCSLGVVQYHELLVIDGKTTIVLLGTGLDLNNGEFTISMDIMAMDLSLTSFEFTLYDGMIKTLDYMKTLTINKLNEYLIIKGYSEEKYESADWTSIQGYLTSGIQAINNATEYAQIDTALLDAKTNVDSVPQIGVTLSIFKTNAKAELSAYATAKDQASYDPQSWTLLQGYVVMGNASINASADYKAVIIALNNAKVKVDGVSKIYKITVTPSYVYPHGTYFIEIQFSSLEYKASFVCSATINGQNASFSRKFILGTYGTSAIFQLAGTNLMTSTYTVKVEILDGTKAYVSTIDVVNGVWVH